DEQRHGEKIGGTPGTEAACDEALMDAPGTLSPAGLADAAIRKKLPRRATGEAKAARAAPMQQIGVFDGSDERKAGFDPSGLVIAGQEPNASSQGREADPINAGEATGSLQPRTAGAVAAPGLVAMAERPDAVVED